MYKKTILAVCVAAVLPLMVGCDNDDDNTVVQPPVTPDAGLPLAPVGKPTSVGPSDALQTFTSAQLTEQSNMIGDHDELDPGTGSLSLSFFMKAPVTGGLHQVIYKGNNSSGLAGYNAYISAGTLYFRTLIGEQRTDAGFDISKLDSSKWHHIVGVINQDDSNGKVELWVNGEKAAEISGEYTNPTFTSGELNTGDNVVVTQTDSGQLIDDLRFFNRALTQTEVNSFTNPENQVPTAGIFSTSLGGNKHLFYADVSDPEGEELSYRWEMGDGRWLRLQQLQL